MSCECDLELLKSVFGMSYAMQAHWNRNTFLLLVWLTLNTNFFTPHPAAALVLMSFIFFYNVFLRSVYLASSIFHFLCALVSIVFERYYRIQTIAVTFFVFKECDILSVGVFLSLSVFFRFAFVFLLLRNCPRFRFCRHSFFVAHFFRVYRLMVCTSYRFSCTQISFIC